MNDMERLIAGLERVAREQQARRRAELERRRREARAAEAEAAARDRADGSKTPAVRERAKVDEPVVGRADEVEWARCPRVLPSTASGAAEAPLSGELIGRFGTQRANGGTSWKGIFIRAGPGPK